MVGRMDGAILATIKWRQITARGSSAEAGPGSEELWPRESHLTISKMQCFPMCLQLNEGDSWIVTIGH